MSAGEKANGVEIESFGALAQAQGAKTVVATLWSVTDESTQLLMSEFYRLLKERPRLNKASALQLAQRAMLEGKLRPSEGGEHRGVRRKETLEANYEHPYYWSPFILIGNWR
jgi:CHAT domain-containing protein